MQRQARWHAVSVADVHLWTAVVHTTVRVRALSFCVSFCEAIDVVPSWLYLALVFESFF